MLQTTGPLTLLPSNAYTDVDGNLLKMSPPPAPPLDNIYTDKSMWEPTTSFEPQNEMGSTEIPVFEGLMFEEAMTFTENQNMLGEPSVTGDLANAFDARAEFMSIGDSNIQAGGAFSDELSSAPHFSPISRSQNFSSDASGGPLPTAIHSPALHTQSSFSGPFNHATHTFLDSPALRTQTPFGGSTNQATRIQDDPFLSLSDEAVSAQLYSLDQVMQETPLDAHLKASRPIETRHTFRRPSTPASQARLTDAQWLGNHSRGFTTSATPLVGHHTNMKPPIQASQDRLPNSQWMGNRPGRLTTSDTPLTAAYKELLRVRHSQQDLGQDWTLINHHSGPKHEDHFFPVVIDSKGPQLWFPIHRGGLEPLNWYNDLTADYYVNMGIKIGEAAHRLVAYRATFPKRPASNLSVNAPRSRRTASATQGVTNPKSAALAEQMPQRRARTNAVIAGRKEMELPTRESTAATDTPARRTPAAGFRLPTEARRVIGTPAPGNKDIRRPRGLKPRDSGTIGEPISIQNWIEKNVTSEQAATSQVLGGLGGSALPKIRNPAKKSKAPRGVLLKPAPLKRLEKRPAPSMDSDEEVVATRPVRRRKILPAPSIASDDEVVETRPTRRKTKLAKSIESDGEYPMPRATKRSRKSGVSQSVVRPQDITRAGSEAGSLADADGENESLTVCVPQGLHRTPDGDSGHAS
ncbi:hypothetical protein MMC32_001528 [Xylographa parallela]|nr:hypothetical protein [Xylographa parallela]